MAWELPHASGAARKREKSIGMEKICHINTNQKKAGATTLFSVEKTLDLLQLCKADSTCENLYNLLHQQAKEEKSYNHKEIKSFHTR